MRINVIPVEYLADVHLQAEYRELALSVHYFKRSNDSKMGVVKSRISKTYTLNVGHGYMWYDKFKYVENRFYELLAEMKKRGFKTANIEKTFKINYIKHIPESAKGDYIPTREDMYINMERILYRIYTKIYIDKKPGFYKYQRESLTFAEWVEFYIDKLKLSDEEFNKISLNIDKDILNSIRKQEAAIEKN